MDALEVVLRRDGTDIQLQRISFEEYQIVPNKTQTGRPTQFTIKRDRDNPTLYLWPIPENSTDILNIEGVRELEDVNRSAEQNADMPKRFLPPLTCGLSYYLSMKTPGTEPDRIGMLKSNYEQLLKTALDEDRERANLFLRPKLGYI